MEPRGEIPQSIPQEKLENTVVVPEAVEERPEEENKETEFSERTRQSFDRIRKLLVRTNFEAAVSTGDLDESFSLFEIDVFINDRAEPAGLKKPRRTSDIAEKRDFARKLKEYAEQLAETGDELAIRARDALNAELNVPLYDPYPRDVEGEDLDAGWERREREDDRRQRIQNNIEEIQKDNRSSKNNLDLTAITGDGGFLGDEMTYQSNTEEILYDVLNIEDARELRASILELAAGKTPLSRSILTDNSHATYIDPLYTRQVTTPREEAMPGTVEDLSHLVGGNSYDLVIAKRLFGAPLDSALENELGRVPTSDEAREKAKSMLSVAINHVKEGGIIFARNDEPFPAPSADFF